MEYRRLGQTDYYVSRLCFGSLTIGPLQKNFSISKGAALIRAALELGVNFIDTAQSYGVYPYIREALKGWNKEVIIASKSYAYTYKMMQDAVEEARQALNRDKIEIFMLHEMESPANVRGHWPAMEYLQEAKAKNIVGASGISTHAVGGVQAALEHAEIEVLHPMLNQAGLGLIDGTIEELLPLLESCHQVGKGIYAMKVLGGGHLLQQAQQAITWAAQLPFVDAIALGMQNQQELEANLAWLSGKEYADAATLSKQPRQLLIQDWCLGCGKCVAKCPQGALHLEDGHAIVDMTKCMFCAYCAGVCRDFAIKVI